MEKLQTNLFVNKRKIEIDEVKKYKRQIEIITDEWSYYPVNLSIYYGESIKELASFAKKGEKSDIFIGIVPLVQRNKDMVIYTRHRKNMNHLLSNGFENLYYKDLDHLGLLPNNTQNLCNNCGDFSTYLTQNLMCLDCI